MDEEKRMAGDYTILTGLRVGDQEVVIGENRKAPTGERFMCAFCQQNEIMRLYSDCMVSDDYLEIAQLYAQRIVEQAEKTRTEFQQLTPPEADITPLTAADCDPITMDDKILDKVIVIKADILRPEYQRATHQLKLCTGGFGAYGRSRGSACFCTDLASGRKSRFECMDVLGTIEPEKLPQWAKDGLARALAESKEKKDTSKEAR